MELPTAESLAPWHFWRQGIRSTLLLGAREVRAAWRTPAYLIPNLIVPVFFYFVMTGSLEEFANGFGIDNWAGFQLPVSIVFAVQGGSAGMNMVADIESGYFDKLLVTPASRVAILLGAMLADFVRVMLQASLVIMVAEATGLQFATGATGAVLLILISSLWGLGYSGHRLYDRPQDRQPTGHAEHVVPLHALPISHHHLRPQGGPIRLAGGGCHHKSDDLRATEHALPLNGRMGCKRHRHRPTRGGRP